MNNGYYFILAIILLVSCSKEEDFHPPDIENLAPGNFSVLINNIKDDSAQVTWTESKDPEQGKVHYSIYLNEELVKEDLAERSYQLSYLSEATYYSGRIHAKDSIGKETIKDFSFTTEKYYLKFLKRVDYQYSENGYSGGNSYSILETDEEDYIIVGTTAFGFNGNQFFVLKVDKYGEVIWKKFYPYQIGEAWNFKIRKSRDGYIMAGRYHLLKLNKDGDEIWYKKIESYDIGESSAEIKSLIEIEDGSIYLAGGRGNPHPYNKQLGVLTKLAANGDILWEKVFDDTYRGFFDDIALQGNTLLIFGSKETSGVTPEEEYELGSRSENIDFWVLKLNLDGSVIWERTYEDGGYAFPRRIIINKNGDYTLAGFTWVAYDFSIGRIIRIDQEGNIIYNIQSDLSSINDIYETDDGGIIATGKMDFSSQGEVLGIYKFDAYGNRQWWKQYYEAHTRIFGKCVIQCRDNGYLIIAATAKNFYYDGDRPQLLIIKTDPDGNFQ